MTCCKVIFLNTNLNFTKKLYRNTTHMSFNDQDAKTPFTLLHGVAGDVQV